MARQYYVYILTNNSRTLYAGVTNNLPRRIYEHKHKLFPGFTKKYNVCYLVYYEEFDDIGDAIAREKRLKRWNRTWKENLLRENNSSWEDLAKDWFEER